MSFHFGLLGLHFLSFWHFGPSFPFILAFWAFILHFGLVVASLWPPPTSCQKRRFPNVPYKEFSSARPGFIFQFLAFWAFISFHFGLLGLHFLSFWPFGPSFPFILAFWARLHFPIFGLLGLHFLSFWPFGPSFPFILAFWAFVSFHFGLLGLHLAFGSTLVKATLVCIYMCMQVCIMSVQFQRFTCIQNCANKNWRPISPDPGQRKPTPLRNPRSTPKKVKKLKQVFSIIIARACSTLVKAILLRMYARMCM